MMSSAAFLSRRFLFLGLLAVTGGDTVLFGALFGVMASAFLSRRFLFVGLLAVTEEDTVLFGALFGFWSSN